MLLDYWKPVKNYEGKYSVSYTGFVRSWDRSINCRGNGKRLVKSRMLKPGLNKEGYYHVVLCNNGKCLTKRNHRLVAEAFIKNSSNRSEINHKVPVKTINFACNLEWCDRFYNMQHAVVNGLMNKGEKRCRAKLTKKQVLEIKLKLLQGYKNIDLSKKYGVSRHTINNIKTGKRWKYIKLEKVA